MLMGEVLLYIYIQSQIPKLVREDLMSYYISVIEVLWLQDHWPHLKPFIFGFCYGPLSANSQYLNNVCEMIDSVWM